MSGKVASVSVSGRENQALSLRHVARVWWPLAISWVILGIGSPMVIATVARLPDPEINLAALGGIVRAITFAIESPLLALLTASAALCRDWDSYHRLRRFMLWGIGLLTLAHALVAFTPLYDLVATKLIAAPAEIIQPGRLGLMITIPFLSAVAYRRFNQGVLIRFGRSDTVVVGTLIRLATNGLVLLTGYLIGSISGAVVAATAMTAGVWTEALYAAWCVRPVLREKVKRAPRADQPLTLGAFLRFYIPLATTSTAMFVMQPITSAALSRMPSALLSLAVFPAVFGVAFVLSSGGTALVEVVVTLSDRPKAASTFRRFSVMLSVLTGFLAFAMAATPLGELWFSTISGLSPSLFAVARRAVWLVLPYVVAMVFQGLFQGVLAHARRTRPITEAVFLSSVVSIAVFGIGVAWGHIEGVYVALVGFSLGAMVQALWLRQRSRPFTRTDEAQAQGLDVLAGRTELGNSEEDAHLCRVS